MTAPTVDRADLLARVDLAALFLELGMAQGRNRQWTCPDPAHAQTGATPPVSLTTGAGHDLWHCHGCGAGGTAVDALRLARGLDLAAAFAHLRDRCGIAPGVTPPPVARPPRPQAAPAPPPDPDHDRLDGPAAAAVLGRYLDARQWPPEVVDAFGLYAVRGRWGRPRVRHPYRVGGEVRWWQDRAVYDDDRGPKWANPTGFARLPYAIDLATVIDWTEDLDQGGRLFVVEGPADVVAMWLAAPGAAVIGIPGTEGVRRWAPLLAGLDVLVLTDPDEAGDRAAVELAELVAAGGGRSARLRPPLDVDDWRRQVGTDHLAAAVVELAEAVDWTEEPA